MTDDVHLGMKKLALHNWRVPDVPKWFPGLTEEVWVPAVMEPKLISAVPEEVIRLFEIARGSVLYGWFFYPLLTLAEEQLYRVQEAAVRARCRAAGIQTEETNKKGKVFPRPYGTLIKELTDTGIIPDDAAELWENARQIRNFASHPDRPMINVPGMVLSGIQVAADRINQLFAANPDYFSVLGQRVQKATGLGDPKRVFPVVAGIDVGAGPKGFHLVALRGATIEGTLHTTDPGHAASWCKERGAVLVGIDAPSAWSSPGEPRVAEHILRRGGYSLYATPTREAAVQNPTFAWMLNGERLYRALAAFYPLLRDIEDTPPFCFETYPYVASCAFAQRKLKADQKNRDRRQILKSVGIDEGRLSNGDFVDAGICALVAISVSIDYASANGAPGDGFIVTPPWPPSLGVEMPPGGNVPSEDGDPFR